jgi:hypothetical protein
MVKNGKSNLDHSALYLLLKKLKRNWPSYRLMFKYLYKLLK